MLTGNQPVIKFKARYVNTYIVFHSPIQADDD